MSSRRAAAFGQHEVQQLRRRDGVRAFGAEAKPRILQLGYRGVLSRRRGVLGGQVLRRHNEDSHP